MMRTASLRASRMTASVHESDSRLAAVREPAARDECEVALNGYQALR